MDVKSLLPPQHVVLRLNPGTRREILRQICQPLLKDNIITDLELFLDDLERREEQITTQVDSCVALPHARSNGVRRLGFAIGLAPTPGIAYSSEVAETCRVFFLLAIPAFAPTAHLPLLQFLANFAHQTVRIQKMLTADTPGKVTRQLATFKG